MQYTRFHGFTFLFFTLFTAFYIWQIVSFVLGIMRLVDMYNFYTHLLRIPDVCLFFFPPRSEIAYPLPG